MQPEHLREGEKEYVRKQLRNIDLSDPQKWDKLYATLRHVGGLQGTQKFYPAEDLIAIIEKTRKNPSENINKVTDGEVSLHTTVMKFIAFDNSIALGLELNGFRPGDKVIHPFTKEEVTVTFVGTRVVNFVPKAYLDQYRNKGQSPGTYQVLRNSPDYFVLGKDARFVMAGERDTEPSAEIESENNIERGTLVVPLNELQRVRKPLRGYKTDNTASV